MASHSSATARRETPHVNRTTTTNMIVNALKQRAEAVINNRSIDAQSRAIIRYALETNDPWLAELVRRAEVGERIADTIDFSQASETYVTDSSEKIEALAEMICRAGDESAVALLVLMGTLQKSSEPKVLANTAKHFAFTRCGELNVHGMVDAQIEVLGGELFAGDVVQ